MIIPFHAGEVQVEGEVVKVPSERLDLQPIQGRKVLTPQQAYDHLVSMKQHSKVSCWKNLVPELVKSVNPPSYLEAKVKCIMCNSLFRPSNISRLAAEHFDDNNMCRIVARAKRKTAEKSSRELQIVNHTQPQAPPPSVLEQNAHSVFSDTAVSNPRGLPPINKHPKPWYPHQDQDPRPVEPDQQTWPQVPPVPSEDPDLRAQFCNLTLVVMTLLQFPTKKKLVIRRCLQKLPVCQLRADWPLLAEICGSKSLKDAEDFMDMLIEGDH